ncbi:MAG: hypothetical protein ABSF09_13040 [Candidatus Bathyarchaeia archaeon]|jgi:hypothetical protein
MISQKTKDRLEKTGIVLCFAGLFAILQPFSMLLYQYGFQILCIGGFMYVAMGYVPANVRIPKAVVIVLSVLGVVVGFLLLGIVLTPILI